MIRLKPEPENSFICPQCLAEEPRIHEFKFETVNMLACCTCARCHLEFYAVLPVGHCIDYLLCIGKESGNLIKPVGPDWLLQSVMQAHLENSPADVSVEKVIHKACKKVIILNTLDTLYGHVLLKLFNAFHHLDRQDEYGLIVIVPRIFKWLVPKGCAEAWIVDLTLDELRYGYRGLDQFIMTQMDSFEEVYLSRAESHPSLGPGDIERVTGVIPFDLTHFTQQKPAITFVLREDRWWFSNKLDYWLYRAARKTGFLDRVSRLLSWRQNGLVKKTIRLIKQEWPQATFHIAGLGKTGTFDLMATDTRQEQTSTSVERAWCELYSRSQLVIGIHGSNMLLPSALAAGCIEILPEDRYGNLCQDLCVRYGDRKQLFLYRFADQYASSRSIAGKVIAILRDYEMFNRHMTVPRHTLAPSMIG